MLRDCAHNLFCMVRRSCTSVYVSIFPKETGVKCLTSALVNKNCFSIKDSTKDGILFCQNSAGKVIAHMCIHFVL